ncbi:MAG: rRNA-processing protein sof1 [Chaenotheca gracillima]|nr:MAG: rRNA-processing protein sof1 [Chaenotheca gracillima]
MAPAATNGTVDGDKPSSQFLSHLSSFPLASDFISFVKSNSYGQKGISLADQGYDTFARPFFPYLAGPYQYVSPYVHKADSLADTGLSKLETTFPVVTRPTNDLKGDIKHIVFFPYAKANEGKTYVFDVYGNEYEKVGGQGLVKTGRAVVSTSLTVSSQTLHWLSTFLGEKREQAKATANGVANGNK